eukprot:COSAG02_NODE_922_length_15907_cov_4.423303_8_plen_372_part_00
MFYYDKGCSGDCASWSQSRLGSQVSALEGYGHGPGGGGRTCVYQYVNAYGYESAAYCLSCRSGHAGDGDGNCRACPPGTHRCNGIDASCVGTPCAAGTYGQSGATGRENASCTACAQGFFSPDGAETCAAHCIHFGRVQGAGAACGDCMFLFAPRQHYSMYVEPHCFLDGGMLLLLVLAVVIILCCGTSRICEKLCRNPCARETRASEETGAREARERAAEASRRDEQARERAAEASRKDERRASDEQAAKATAPTIGFTVLELTGKELLITTLSLLHTVDELKQAVVVAAATSGDSKLVPGHRSGLAPTLRYDTTQVDGLQLVFKSKLLVDGSETLGACGVVAGAHINVAKVNVTERDTYHEAVPPERGA